MSPTHPDELVMLYSPTSQRAPAPERMSSGVVSNSRTISSSSGTSSSASSCRVCHSWGRRVRTSWPSQHLPSVETTMTSYRNVHLIVSCLTCTTRGQKKERAREIEREMEREMDR